MMTDVIHLLAAFCFFSTLGWILEVCYRSYRAGSFVNPGLLSGPYLILYGGSALVLVAASSFLEGSVLAVRALVYFAVITGLELISGYIARRFFHVRLWDYSDRRFNYKGYVCLRFSVYWVLAAFAFEYLIYPVYGRILAGVPMGVVTGLTVAVCLAMLIDFTAVWARGLLRVTPQEEENLKRQYTDIARPLLENQEVARLSRYTHHRKKTRLQHVNEVAYVSFLLGKRFSLDCDSIVRGALLHDLFYYDWLTEGPRLHGFRHPAIALANARKIADLSRKEEDIITKHMWPLTVRPPRYAESLIVSVVDTVCGIGDYVSVKHNAAETMGRIRPALEKVRKRLVH
jgi:uncharacterized protein